MMPENGSGQPPSPAQHDDYYYDDDQPGQEISFDDTGNTIVAGNRIDIESDDGSEIHIQHRHHNHDDDDDDDDSNIPLRNAKSPSGRGGTCHWLKTSSSKVKYVLGFGAILFVAFVAVMAVGLVQMSSSSTSSDGGDGSVSSAQLGDEVDGGIGSSENGVSPLPSPTMAPIMETRTSSAPTNLYEIFPVEDAVIQITLPNDMEGLVHTLGGDANDSDVENWKDMEVILEDTISSTLQEQLPDEYVVGAVQIVQFDDFVPSYSKRTRLLQNDGDNTHTVIYSTSVSVNCANSDCSTASEQIEDAVTYLSTMEFELTSTETTPLTDPPTEAATTTRPTGSPTDPPSKASTGVPTVDSTDINTIIVDEETSMPTSKATSMPSLEPSSAKPTTSPTSKPTTVPRLEITTSCSADEPCGMCKGQCQDDTQCQTGLQCFKRIYLEYIPGCIGPGNQGQNYCYDPFAEGSGSEILLSTEDAKCDDKRRCEKCFGDCNSDDECEKDLYCYRRAGFELVPGCAGQGVQGRDYCFDPEDIDGGDYR